MLSGSLCERDEVLYSMSWVFLPASLCREATAVSPLYCCNIYTSPLVLKVLMDLSRSGERKRDRLQKRFRISHPELDDWDRFQNPSFDWSEVNCV